MRRCRIPVLTYTIGLTVLERPIKGIALEPDKGSSFARVAVTYQQVTVQSTDNPEDFRYRELVESTHIYDIAKKHWHDFPKAL